MSQTFVVTREGVDAPGLHSWRTPSYVTAFSPGRGRFLLKFALILKFISSSFPPAVLVLQAVGEILETFNYFFYKTRIFIALRIPFPVRILAFNNWIKTAIFFCHSKKTKTFADFSFMCVAFQKF